MLQRDFLMNEARKFALILAKLMGLKIEGSSEEFQHFFNDILYQEYNLELNELLDLDEDKFKKRLVDASYTSEKLNALSQMFYVFAEPFKADSETSTLLKKVLAIFDLLETDHHYESFDNLSKRQAIYNYFNANYERA
jgi:hypothetical protein